MDIDELLTILEKSKSGKLQKIDENLYDRIKEKIAELEERKKNANGEEEIVRLEDEIRTLKRIQRRLFEVRTSKIIKMAWAKVCETETDEEFDNMTSVEKSLFKKLVEILENFKRLIIEHVKKEEAEIKYVLVRIKKDIPEFVGVDGKTYKLRREDVVVLPELNAKALIKDGVAEEIEVKG
jgi:DNA replication factor GINS